MSSKKNKWRGRKGGLQFKRETSRYESDGSPMGHDTLYVRIWRKGCCIVQPNHSVPVDAGRPGIWFNCMTWRKESPIQAAHQIRHYLKNIASKEVQS